MQTPVIFLKVPNKLSYVCLSVVEVHFVTFPALIGKKNSPNSKNTSFCFFLYGECRESVLSSKFSLQLNGT